MLYHFLHVFFVATLLTFRTKIDTPEEFFSLGFLGINPRAPSSSSTPDLHACASAMNINFDFICL